MTTLNSAEKIANIVAGPRSKTLAEMVEIMRDQAEERAEYRAWVAAGMPQTLDEELDEFVE